MLLVFPCTCNLIFLLRLFHTTFKEMWWFICRCYPFFQNSYWRNPTYVVSSTVSFYFCFFPSSLIFLKSLGISGRHKKNNNNKDILPFSWVKRILKPKSVFQTVFAIFKEAGLYEENFEMGFLLMAYLLYVEFGLLNSINYHILRC